MVLRYFIEALKNATGDLFGIYKFLNYTSFRTIKLLTDKLMMPTKEIIVNNRIVVTKMNEFKGRKKLYDNGHE